MIIGYYTYGKLVENNFWMYLGTGNAVNSARQNN